LMPHLSRGAATQDDKQSDQYYSTHRFTSPLKTGTRLYVTGIGGLAAWRIVGGTRRKAQVSEWRA
jgi:hypothetical protein